MAVTSTDGSAVSPADFTAFAGGTFSLTDASSDVLSISVADDPNPEPAETFTVSLALTAGSDPQCVLGDSVATITITDNDGSDVTSPTVTVEQGASQLDPTGASPILFDVVFSEAVFGFTGSDVSFAGSTAAGTLAAAVSGAGAAYTVSVSGMTAGDIVVASIPAGGVLDTNSNPNTASTSIDNTVTFTAVDVTEPTVTIDQAVSQVDPTTVSPILFTVVFSEPVSNFVTGDVTLAGTAGATTTAVSGSGTTYTVSVSGMTQNGTVIASIAAGVASDTSANPNQASTSIDNTVTFTGFDVTGPTVTVEQAVGQFDPTSASPILFTVVFSEPVLGFTSTDLSFTGSTVGGTLAGLITGSGPTYQVAVSGMIGDGDVVLSIGADQVADAATNANLASTSTDNTVTYVAPTGSDPLTLNLPGAITRNNDPGQPGAVVNYPAVTASGGVPPIVVDCVPASGTFFPLGATTVQCTATDGEAGLDSAIVSGSFTVTVNDTEAPVIADNPDLVRTTSGTAAIPVTFSVPTATDNSGAATVTCTRASGSNFALGTATVTCTATDASGNSASSSFTVTVTSSGGLPPTGSSAIDLTVLAALLAALGGVFTWAARRRLNVR